MCEIWKDIDGTEGMYRISNRGNIIVRDYRKKGYWASCAVTEGEGGYKFAYIYYDGVRRRMLVHRLVAKAFVPNPNNYTVVNHRDENPRNNNAENLEWCTTKYNVTYGSAIEKRRQKAIGVYRADNAVAQYTKDGDLVEIYKSARDASFALTGDRMKIAETIVQVCRGARNLCRGYQWRYAEGDVPKKIDAYRKTDMIEQLTLDGEHIAYYDSSYAAQKATGACPAQILKCCKGTRTQTAGFKWRYHKP